MKNFYKPSYWIFLVIVFMIAGCASYPMVDEAKSSYDEAKNNADVVSQAPTALEEAEEQFEIIDNLKKNGASKTLINHHAYIARQKVAYAHQMAVLNAKQDELAQVEQEHQMLVAQVQQAESRAAERMAERARIQAEEARQQSEMLANKLSELEAERTERGLVVNLRNVLFESGNATIRPGAEDNLARLSRFLIEYPERKIMVEGFTDNTGSDEINQTLSEKRAEAVKQALVAFGIEPNRIMTRGYGSQYAIAENNSAAGRQQNRRVEVVISDEKGTVAERAPIQ